MTDFEIKYIITQLEDERRRRKLAEDALLRANAALDSVYGSTRYRLGSRIADAADKLKPRKAAASVEDLSLPWLHGRLPQVTPPEIMPIRTGTLTEADYPVLSVPQWPDPKVSVIIPVYNQFEFTYHCVESILRNSGSITYEILIADDCSTDLTSRITEILPGVRHIRNPKNLRFLRNCNNAAAHAKGEYILLLNNDTQVQPNWLAPLVELMERSSDIGMVGSKLIYPDGRLQEAGGIVWNDGTAWNYGNKGDPTLPEFNYVKEADYISGAAIMLPRSLWEELGGFDEAFCPSYCEDSDLAFGVRSKGYRVMYQPASVVVHFEGVSNGTDTGAGLKQYQIVNTETLKNKWSFCIRRHAQGGTCVFHARDRSFGKLTVVIFAQTAADAEGLAAFHIAAGCHVKVVPMDFTPHAPYTNRLQQQGVEVLYGNVYAETWESWLRENGRFFDRVCFADETVEQQLAALVRSCTDAPFFYTDLEDCK